MRLGDLDALKKKIEGVVENEMPIDKKWALGLRYALKLIDNAPTVEEVSVIEFKEPLPFVKAQKIVKASSKRPQGEWVVQRLQNGFDDVYCPFCNARPTRSEYGYYLKDNFCHECGADMRGIEK